MNFDAGRVVTVLLWMAVTCNVAVPFGPAAPYLYGLGAFLVIAHIAECLIFTSLIKQNHENIIEGYLLTFIFGYVHISEMQKKAPAEKNE